MECRFSVHFTSSFGFSSDEEFDRPIREFVEKSMAQSSGGGGVTKKPVKHSSTTSTAFENEMEDELDQIYHNFISKGTFELPLSSKRRSSRLFDTPFLRL